MAGCLGLLTRSLTQSQARDALGPLCGESTQACPAPGLAQALSLK